MASQNNIEFRVGVIVLICLIVLAGSLYWLQGYKLERNAQVIRVRFRDVGTLAVGDRVTVSGVHRGKVNDLRLTEDGVLVELLVYRDVVLKRDASFTIKNLGVMGDRFVAIDPGRDSLRLEAGQVVDGYYDIGIPEVVGRLGEVITELRNLVASVKTTFASDTSMAKLNRTIDNVERLSSSLARYLERNENKLDRTVQNFLAASRELDRLLTRNADRIDSSMSRFDRLSVGMEFFVQQLDTLALSARGFAEMLDNEEGTLQLLLEDRRLYDDLRRTADNIDDLVKDIRENPRKYINLKVELF
ncbi:MAG TPA: MlaD family protein [Acidobacteriota bacterium]|nr:MlaD family protein [Acidobacteriota bacterium]